MALIYWDTPVLQ
jgi:hypothetical protein